MPEVIARLILIAAGAAKKLPSIKLYAGMRDFYMHLVMM
jgi:hypothetical protein